MKIGYGKGEAAFLHNHFWWRWVVANALGEFVGLGIVAAAGYLIFQGYGEPRHVHQALLIAGTWVLLGAFEGLAVGFAQRRVLMTRVPDLRGWVVATVFGAMLAWAVGVIPSTVASLGADAAATPAEEPGPIIVLLLATGMGLVAGPVLAFFQWWKLRRVLPGKALYWLPANAVAWAVGMPVIFLGIQVSEAAANTPLVITVIALSLLLAGAVVGAIHGRFLVRMLQE